MPDHIYIAGDADPDKLKEMSINLLTAQLSHRVGD